MDYTRQVAEFVMQTNYESIPPAALEVAKLAIFDCVGVSLAGSREESAKICSIIAKEESSNSDATVIGQGFKSSTLMAAFTNGTAAHALDYDHSFSLMGQPTAGLVPAILTLGEKLQANGRDIITACVIGFEVTAKIARTLPELSSQGKWHSTATIGSLGAAVACGKLFRLDINKIQLVLGIASSMASGLVSNFATMTKPLHSGFASRNGVLAARLALSGFSSNPISLDKGQGLYDVFSKYLPYDFSPMTELGHSYDLIETGIKIKPYPCGGLTHTAIDAVLKIQGRQKLSPHSIESIKVGVTQHVYNTISNKLPESGLQGKFSMPYIIARSIIDGKIVLDTFTDKATQEPLVRSLANKIHMIMDPDIADTKEGTRPCKITILHKDGRILSEHVRFPRGTMQAPLSLGELRWKFTECASRILNEKDVKEVINLLDRLESLNSLDPLFKHLIGSS